MNTEKVKLLTDPAQIEELRKAHAKGDARRAYWDANFARLRELFPDEFVAVSDGEVVVHGPNLPYVMGFLDGRGIEPGDFYLEYMDTGSRRLIL